MKLILIIALVFPMFTYAQNWKAPLDLLSRNATGTLYATIDELRIWNDACTVAEIADNMEIELAGNESNLVAY